MSNASPAISLFDVTGPIMTGPSSSHTAGAVRIGIMGRQIFGQKPEEIHLFFYGPLAETYKGHLTDAGVVAGLIGMDVDDPGIRTALEQAKEMGIPVIIHTQRESKKNPNTIEMVLSKTNYQQRIIGLTVGGGEVLIEEVEGIKTDFRGKEDMLIAWGPGNALASFIKGEPSLEILQNYGSQEDGSAAMISVRMNKQNEKVWKSRKEELKGSGINLRSIRSLYGYKLNNPKPLLTSIRETLKKCTVENISLPEAALLYETSRSGLSAEEIREQFRTRWAVMADSIEKGLKGPNKMVGGLMGGKDAQKILAAYENKKLISGQVLSLGIARAIASMETNASMGRVVACPTAGACGVIPGIFSSVSEKTGADVDNIVDGLLVASLFGVLVSMRAPISGALGGCQSEIGVASAMAAAGLAQMAGGSPVEVSEAFALALKSVLGLICDPVAGPVEVPCIKRNAIGVANALSACDMALSGVVSVIPPDEVIDALINVQQLMPVEFRGSTFGGLGATATGIRLKNQWLSKCSKCQKRQDD